jgi:hypothetical protein
MLCGVFGKTLVGRTTRSSDSHGVDPLFRPGECCGCSDSHFEDCDAHLSDFIVSGNCDSKVDYVDSVLWNCDGASGLRVW